MPPDAPTCHLNGSTTPTMIADWGWDLTKAFVAVIQKFSGPLPSEEMLTEVRLLVGHSVHESGGTSLIGCMDYAAVVFASLARESQGDQTYINGSEAAVRLKAALISNYVSDQDVWLAIQWSVFTERKYVRSALEGKSRGARL